MTTNDTMLRVIPKTAGLRGLACVTTELAREAALRHRASPLAAAALGEGLTAAALLGGLLKAQQRVAIKIDGDGPAGKLVAERALAAGITAVVFDRGPYLYHGRVKALADAAREGGLNF